MISLYKSDLQALRILPVALEEMREAYIAISDGRANLPPVGYLQMRAQNADCHVKFGHVSGHELFVVKVATGFYDNPKNGLSASNGAMLALSAETGALIAVLCDEGWLTDLRTGVGGALVTLQLCRQDSRHFGIVGTGTQARQQIQCLHDLTKTPISFAVWGRNTRNARALSLDFARQSIEVVVEENLEALCRRSDVLITTTPSRNPIVRAEWIRPGTHITAIGADAPGKQELDSEIFKRVSCVAVDSLEQCIDHGEISAAVAQGHLDPRRCIQIGCILSGQSVGRLSDNDITVADLTGVATQDIGIVRAALSLIDLAPRSLLHSAPSALA